MKVSHIFKRYGDKIVFDDFGLELPDCGCVSVMGDSGCGKTTLLRILAGLEATDVPASLPAFGRISFVFQEPRLIPGATALENIVCAAGCTPAQAKELLSELGFESQECELLPQELSGGMKQRVSIARALLYDGEVFLLDEAFKGLDCELAERCALMFRDKAKRAPIISVTHSYAEAELLGGSLTLLGGSPCTVISQKAL